MDRIDRLPPEEVIFGSTTVLKPICNVLPRIAQSPVSVLLLGESGTGKEIMARLIHATSDRSSGPFIKLSCPAIPLSLLETELFGYEKGAFTGASGTKRGRVEQAHGGTLFLDEIGDLDSSVQAKLLQVLQNGTFARVGGLEERQIDIRLISATNQDLRTSSRQGTFRLDLFFRINDFTIELPPLRRRIVDLPVLVDYFLELYTSKFCQPRPPLSQSAMRIMENYDWPGNIRELENVVRSYVIMGTEELIAAELLVVARSPINADIQIDRGASLKQITKLAVQDLERQIILKVLQKNDWNRKKTAKSLKISYRSLLYKMREGGFPSLT